MPAQPLVQRGLELASALRLARPGVFLARYFASLAAGRASLGALLEALGTAPREAEGATLYLLFRAWDGASPRAVGSAELRAACRALAAPRRRYWEGPAGEVLDGADPGAPGEAALFRELEARPGSSLRRALGALCGLADGTLEALPRERAFAVYMERARAALRLRWLLEDLERGLRAAAEPELFPAGPYPAAVGWEAARALLGALGPRAEGLLRFGEPRPREPAAAAPPSRAAPATPHAQDPAWEGRAPTLEAADWLLGELLGPLPSPPPARLLGPGSPGPDGYVPQRADLGGVELSLRVWE